MSELTAFTHFKFATCKKTGAIRHKLNGHLKWSKFFGYNVAYQIKVCHETSKAVLNQSTEKIVKRKQK